MIPAPGSVPPWRWSMLSIFATTPSSASLESITVRGTSTSVPLENCTTVIATEPSSGTFAGSRSAVEKPSRCSCQSVESMLPEPSTTMPDVDRRRGRRRCREPAECHGGTHHELLPHPYSVRPMSLKRRSTRPSARTVDARVRSGRRTVSGAVITDLHAAGQALERGLPGVVGALLHVAHGQPQALHRHLWSIRRVGQRAHLERRSVSPAGADHQRGQHRGNPSTPHRGRTLVSAPRSGPGRTISAGGRRVRM